jgi:hypothetical protein
VALFRTRTAAVYGIDAHLIDVEVDMYPGSGRDFITVGMPDTAVRESRERIKSALLNSGGLQSLHSTCRRPVHPSTTGTCTSWGLL